MSHVRFGFAAGCEEAALPLRRRAFRTWAMPFVRPLALVDVAKPEPGT